MREEFGELNDVIYVCFSAGAKQNVFRKSFEYGNKDGALKRQWKEMSWLDYFLLRRAISEGKEKSRTTIQWGIF